MLSSGCHIISITCRHQADASKSLLFQMDIRYYNEEKQMQHAVRRVISRSSERVMPYQVHSHFSVYDLVDWQNVSNIFVEKLPMLAFYCHRIETEIVDRKLDAEVYASFQQMERVRPVLPRYRRIVAGGANVALFGKPGDTDPSLSEFRCVYLNDQDLLVKEWFLVANHPEIQRAVIAREIGDPELSYAERTYQGVITSDAAEVERIARIVGSAIREA